MKHRPASLTLTALILAPALAAAEPVNETVARDALFDTKGRKIELARLPGLSEEVNALLLQALQASAANVRYYGAIAMEPDGGLESEATAQSENFHSKAAADAAALADCNSRRTGRTPCVVVARTLPRGHEPRAVELSLEATEAFRKEYRPAKRPKALAISPATGKWAIASGGGAAGAAVTECNRRAQAVGATDCAIVIAD